MKQTASDIEEAGQHVESQPQKPTINDVEAASSYYSLLRKNRPFRLYLSSYMITHAGEWLTYVASITMIEMFQIGEDKGTLSRTKISILVVVRLIPNVLFSALGGALADARDRRISMILLDVMGGIVALLYLAAYQFRSIALVYLVAFAQQSVAALYEPCRSSIVPLMVSTDGDLKKATTLSVLAWSLMAAIGAALGGLFVAVMGVQLCFVIDSVSYFASALLVHRIGGKYNASEGHDTPPYDSIWQQIQGMTVDGARYVRSSFFGGIVFVKASGAILFGASDVLNVSFAERNDDEHSTSIRLGALFAAAGVGCIFGPLVADCVRGDKPAPSSLQLGCIGGLLILTSGYAGLGLTDNFFLVCFFSAVRAAGSANMWVDSSVILQIFSTPQMLGRVMAVEYALATFMEASSAVLAGYLQDHFHISAERVSLLLSGMGVTIVLSWSLYHWCGRGVAGRSTYTAMMIRKDAEAEATSVIEVAPLVVSYHREVNGAAT